MKDDGVKLTVGDRPPESEASMSLTTRFFCYFSQAYLNIRNAWE
ncbi:hypothetical protein [Anabaena sp. CCY 9910]